MKLKSLLIIGAALVTSSTFAHADGRTFGDGLPEFLEKFDVNGDGKIDEEERQAIKDAREARHEDWIAQWDTDGDGRLSLAEREAAKAALRAKIEEKRNERFAEVAGEDGVIDTEEFAAIPAFSKVGAERVAALFARIDADSSGGIDLEEFNSRLRPSRPLLPGTR